MSNNMNRTKYSSQNIDNMSFDESLGVSMVEIIGADGVLKNPATEDKQDSQIVLATALNALVTTLNSQGAKDDTLIALQNTLALLLDRLEFGNITSNSKTLRVQLNPELTSTIAIASAQTLATVTTVASVTNTVRQGDLQMQRVNEALLDIAFINGITNNLSIT